MIKLERKERAGDRRSKVMHVYGEAVKPEFVNGMVQVSCKTLAGAAAFRRRGFRDAPAPAAGPTVEPSSATATRTTPADREAELRLMSKGKLASIAKDMQIRGRSTMDHGELVEAILIVEAG